MKEGCFQVAGHTCLTAVRQFPSIRVTAPVLLSPARYASHTGSRWGCCNRRISYTVPNNTRQGYARKSTLKLAGYSIHPPCLSWKHTLAGFLCLKFNAVGACENVTPAVAQSSPVHSVIPAADTILPRAQTVILTAQTVILIAQTVILIAQTVIPAKAGIHTGKQRSAA